MWSLMSTTLLSEAKLECNEVLLPFGKIDANDKRGESCIDCRMLHLSIPHQRDKGTTPKVHTCYYGVPCMPG